MMRSMLLVSLLFFSGALLAQDDAPDKAKHSAKITIRDGDKIILEKEIQSDKPLTDEELRVEADKELKRLMTEGQPATVAPPDKTPAREFAVPPAGVTPDRAVPAPEANNTKKTPETNLSITKKTVTTETTKPDKPPADPNSITAKLDAKMEQITSKIEGKFKDIGKQLSNKKSTEGAAGVIKTAWQIIPKDKLGPIPMVVGLFLGSDKANPLLALEKEQQTLEFLRGADPAMFNSLLKMKTNMPDIYTRILAALEQQTPGDKKLQQEDPELFRRISELRTSEAEIKDISDKIKQTASSAEREQLRQTLKNKLTKVFEAKEAARRAELDRLEQEALKLREVVQKRQSQKDVIIERRLRELVGEDDLTAWN